MWELQGMETNTKTHTEDIIYDSRDETGMQFSEEHHWKQNNLKENALGITPFEGKRRKSCQRHPAPPPFGYSKQPQGKKS